MATFPCNASVCTQAADVRCQSSRIRMPFCPSENRGHTAIAIEQRILVVIEANDFVRGRFSICTRISRIAMCGKSSIAPSQRDTTPTFQLGSYSYSSPSTKRGRLGRLCELDALVCRKSCTFNLVLHPDRILGHRLVKFLTCERSKSYFSTSSSCCHGARERNWQLHRQYRCTSPRVKVPIQETAANLRMARSSDGTLVGEEGANSDD